MPIVIGTDEAGYGPNLGPLVITATTWNLPAGMTAEDMWTALDQSVVQTASSSDHRLHVADSKKVYSSGKSIRPLELSALAFLSVLADCPSSVPELGRQVGGRHFDQGYATTPRLSPTPVSLPCAVDAEELVNAGRLLNSGLAAANIELCRIQSCVMFPREFNQLVQAAGSKGIVLSAATLQLVKQATESIDLSEGGWVICDKHGGRNRYDDIISEAFDDRFVFRLEESRQRSCYRLENLHFCFRTKAEELLPAALSSIVSKYVREMLMEEFNAFWQSHLPGLKPTKGYPVDALRFWDDIAELVHDLQLDKTTLWRCR